MEGNRRTDKAKNRAAGPQGTMLFQADKLQAEARMAEPQENRRATVAEPILEGRSPGIEGKRFTLRAGRQTIGRKDSNDIVVSDASVSSSHAWILNQNGQHVIMNMLSTNGTLVNDERVHEATLRHGDRIRLGNAEFVFLTREGGRRPIGRPGLWLAGALLLAAVATALYLLLR
jgi:pSer/pThr/pTyr-binding forkhead associated (FHA) protein